MSGPKRWWVHANNAHPMDKVTFLPVGCVEVVAASDHEAAIAEAIAAERKAAAAIADDFAKLEAAAEREACAKIVDGYETVGRGDGSLPLTLDDVMDNEMVREIAAAIRSRRRQP